MGTSVEGVSRLGKWEMRGVPGGGRMRENSEASELRGVCFGDRASMRFVFLERRETRDWGVTSAAKAAGNRYIYMRSGSSRRGGRTLGLGSEDYDVSKLGNIVLYDLRGRVLG